MLKGLSGIHNDPQRSKKSLQRPTTIQIKSTTIHNISKRSLIKKNSQRTTTNHNNPKKFAIIHYDPKQSTQSGTTIQKIHDDLEKANV